MTTFTDTIRILITADGAKASSELEKVGKTAQREMDKADKSTRNWSASFTRAGVGMVTGAAVIGAGLYSAAKAADEAQQAQLRLDNTIKNSPRLTEKSARAFRDLATALMHKTVVDDDAVISAEALLGQMGLQESQILSLTPLVVDLSRKMGVDLDTAAKAVGKAVNGSGTALSRMGIQVKAGADGVVDFADVMDALSRKVGGFAEGEAQTFAGQLQQLKVQLGEIAENVGGGVIPVFEGLLAPIKAVSEGFASLPQGAQSTIGTVLGIGTAAVGAVGGVSVLVGQLGKLKEVALKDPTAGLSGGLTTAGKVMTGVGIAAVGLGAAFTLIEQRSQEAQQRVDELTEAVRATGKTLEDVAAQKLAEFVGSLDDSDLAMSKLGLTTKDLADAILLGGDSWDRVRGKVADYQKEMLRGTKPLDATGIAIGLLGDALDKQHTAYVTSQGDIKGTNKAQSDLAGAYQGSTTAAEELGAAVAGTGSALDGQKVKIKTVADETRDYGLRHNAVRRSVEEHEKAVSHLIGEIERYQDVLKGNRDSSRDASLAQLDAADAVQGVADAQSAYNDAVAEYGPNSAEAAAAQRDLQRAVIGAYQAQDDATQAILDNAAAQAGYDRGTEGNVKQTRRYVAELVKARNETTGPTRDAINKHIAKILGIPEERATEMTLPEIRKRMRELDDHKGKVEKVPGSKNTHVTTTGTDKANRELEGTRARIEALKDKNVRVTLTAIIDAATQPIFDTLEALGWVPPGRAAGGPVTAGQPYVVGEEGPELFIPSGSGTIVPASETNSTIRALGAPAGKPSGGGDVYHFHFGGPVASERDAERWVTAAMSRAKRRGDALVA